KPPNGSMSDASGDGHITGTSSRSTRTGAGSTPSGARRRSPRNGPPPKRPPPTMAEIDWENLPCALHGQIEPHQDGSIWCPECWHTYWDDADLIATELAEWASFYGEERDPPTVEQISCCPLCLHDW